MSNIGRHRTLLLAALLALAARGASDGERAAQADSAPANVD